MDGKAGSDPRLTPAWGTEARRAAPDSERRLFNPGPHRTRPAAREGRGPPAAAPQLGVRGLRGGGSRGAHRGQAERARGPGRGTEGRPPPGLSVPPASRQGPRWAGEPGPTGKGLPRATPRRVLGARRPHSRSPYTPPKLTAQRWGAPPCPRVLAACPAPRGPSRPPLQRRLGCRSCPGPRRPPRPPPARPPPFPQQLSREPPCQPPSAAPPRPPRETRLRARLAGRRAGAPRACAVPREAQSRGCSARGRRAAAPGLEHPGHRAGGEGRGRSPGTEPS